MAAGSPTITGTPQSCIATTVAATTGGATASGTFNATGGTYTLFVITYWSNTATVADPVDTIQLSVAVSQPNTAQVAVSPSGPFSAILPVLVPNTFTGTNIPFTINMLSSQGIPFPTGQPNRQVTVSVMGITNSNGLAGLGQVVGSSSSATMSVTGIAGSAGTIFVSHAGTSTFPTAGGTGAMVPNSNYSTTPAVVSVPPWVTGVQTGSGAGTIFPGGATGTLTATANSPAAQILAISLAQQFAPADVRVPSVYDVQIDNQTYLVDYSQPFYRQFSEQLDTITRTQADGGQTTGENSMDPKGLWRRSQEDWRMGASQTWLDRKQSNNVNSLPNGFNLSKGLELGVGWQAQLLHGVSIGALSGTASPTIKMLTLQTVRGSTDDPGVIISATASSSNITTQHMTTAGTLTSNVLVTAPSGTIIDFCTDGFAVYFVTGTTVYMYTPVFTGSGGSGGTTTALATGTISVNAKIFFANGRLILTDKGKIWNVTSSTSTPLGTTNTGVNPLVYTAGNSNTWFTAIAGGLTGIYVISNSIDTSSFYAGNGQIWILTMGSDGLMLNPPQIAGLVPSNESILSALFYLNNLILYTTTGVRCCAVNSDGSVTLGTLITNPVQQPVTARNANQIANPSVAIDYNMCAQGEYVYFPLSNFDADPTIATATNPQGITATGVGRIDLGNFVISGLLPAWQSYIYTGSPGNNTYAPGLVGFVANSIQTGIVQTVALIPAQWRHAPQNLAFAGGVCFGYVTDGLDGNVAGHVTTMLETGNPVGAGYLTSGKIGYDLVDNKVLGALDIQGRNFQGIYSAIATDDEPSTEIELAVANAGTANLTFPLNNTGSHFEVTIGLTSTGFAVANPPTLIRWTLRAYPSPTRPIQWTIPIILNEDLGNLTGQANGYDVRAQLETLYAIVNTGRQVTFRRGVETFVCYLSDISFLPDTPSENGNTLRSFFNGMAYVTINSLPAWQTTIAAG